ncbi:NUMOD3 domain-containing DNA-binding protein [Haloterrigena alkaliphila]|uniref:Nuclease associated modular domain-containing protein n=1 Tax=Haloterrigena alkaliphila TaxID=2816475 RepID=A0A8A2VEK2_9EURY|nr:NUMOD3 domain-containing DNA-binding protein [Haloterrigena alkaliphila]QSW99107.1 hypothetical protein J0X25_17270 [Haloterrigena alkaliphila]
MESIEECPACGRTGFKNEYGIGVHLVRYCEKSTGTQVELGRDLISGENHPMKGREMSEEAKRKIGEASSGREMPEKTKRKISESLKGHEVSEETRQKISESLQGEQNPWYGVTGENHPRYGVSFELDEESREKLSKSLKETYEEDPTKHSMYGRTGEDHPLYGYEWSEVQLQKLSEALRGQVPGRSRPRQVIKTRNIVRNGWEAAVDIISHDAGFDYTYEDLSFELSERTYTPDFVVEDIVIEVKGMVWENDETKANEFMDRHDYTYLVVGSELPCDVHLPWKKREKLPEVINSRL